MLSEYVVIAKYMTLEPIRKRLKKKKRKPKRQQTSQPFSNATHIPRGFIRYKKKKLRKTV